MALSGFGFFHARRPRLCTRSSLLNEINVPWSRAAVFTELSTESGTTLLSGLPKDAPLIFSAYLPARMDRRPFYRALHEPQFLTFLTRAPRVALLLSTICELLRDEFLFLIVVTRSRTAVGAGVLFLRKQLAY